MGKREIEKNAIDYTKKTEWYPCQWIDQIWMRWKLNIVSNHVGHSAVSISNFPREMQTGKREMPTNKTFIFHLSIHRRWVRRKRKMAHIRINRARWQINIPLKQWKPNASWLINRSKCWRIRFNWICRHPQHDRDRQSRKKAIISGMVAMNAVFLFCVLNGSAYEWITTTTTTATAKRCDMSNFL